MRFFAPEKVKRTLFVTFKNLNMLRGTFFVVYLLADMLILQFF